MISHRFLIFYLIYYYIAMPSDFQDLSSQPGMEPMPSAVEAWSPNHWTAREVPKS